MNALLKSASEDGPLKGIMGYETRALVSTDYTNDERSGIVDARSTMVVDGTCVKVCVYGRVHRSVCARARSQPSEAFLSPRGIPRMFCIER